MPCCGTKTYKYAYTGNKYGTANWNLSKKYQGGEYPEYRFHCDDGCKTGAGLWNVPDALAVQLKMEEFVTNVLPRKQVVDAMAKLEQAGFRDL